MKRNVRPWPAVVVLASLIALAIAAFVHFSVNDAEQSGRQTPEPAGVGSESDGDRFRRGHAALFAEKLLETGKLSPFRNVTASVESVGSSECARCHESIAERYFQTGMGQSLALVARDADPPEAVIDDGTSLRKYRVVWREGVMWHQEFLSAGRGDAEDELPGGADEELVLSEYPVKWQIGSGWHSKSYLIEIDGFLVESPVTWYTSRQAWGMSPGFDRPEHPGFARVAESGCLYCHAGDARPLDGASHRLSIHEGAIGCERCHGPGQLHMKHRDAERWNPAAADAQSSTAVIDYSIVNPRHLDRELSDSICGQCHLRSAATVLVPGARLDDYRPGLSLGDIRTDYRFQPLLSPDSPTQANDSHGAQNSGDSMTVVGHIEQLQLSRCYQQSKLSCVTCHDPHDRVSTEERVTHYRMVCLQCHGAEDCHVSGAVLQSRSPANDCTVCHMPRSGTDIPHLTFTHHRIGLHLDQVADRDSVTVGVGKRLAGVLVPLTDSESLPQHVKDAMLGLAYLEFSGRNEGLPHAQEYRSRAYQILLRAWHKGERSPEIASSLVALAAEHAVPPLAEFARDAAEAPDITADMRVNFLLSNAFAMADRNRFLEAADLMQKVVGIRRAPMDWQLLGDFRQAAGDRHQAADAFETALRIAPLNLDVRRWLVDFYLAENEKEKAEQHTKILLLIDVSRRPSTIGR